MSKFSERKILPEIIDDFNWSGKDLEQNLEEIEWINKNLGGTNISSYPVLAYIQENLRRNLKIADIGCGSGDLLKKIQMACGQISKVNLIGVDANRHIIEFAKKKHFSEKEISFIHADVIDHPEQIPKAEVYIMNLFLHHFEMHDIHKILQNLTILEPKLIVINDLQRSRLAYGLFSMLCKIKNASFVTLNDGRLSILKGFNRKEMENIGNADKSFQYKLKWRWAFRWQLILKRIITN